VTIQPHRRGAPQGCRKAPVSGARSLPPAESPRRFEPLTPRPCPRPRNVRNQDQTRVLRPKSALYWQLDYPRRVPKKAPPENRRPLPCRSATRRTLTWATRSRNYSSIFVSTCSCAPRVFRRASQGPQGRVVPFGGARQSPDRRLRTAVQQRRPGRVPRFIGAYHHHRTPCLCVWV
jgi:hypothetical protein